MKTILTKLLFLVVIILANNYNSKAQCTYSSDFETGAIGTWDYLSGYNTIASNNSHSGQYSLKLSAYGSYSSVISTQNDFGCGTYSFWFYATGSVTDIYLRLHYINSNNFYQLGLLPAGTDNPKLRFSKKVNGSHTVIAEQAPSFTTNQWVEVKVVHDNLGLYEIYINGSLKIQVTDASLLTPAKVVLMSYDQIVYLDDFCYETCVTPPIDTCVYSYDFEAANLNDWNILSGNFSISSTEIHSGLYSLTAGTEGVESIIASDDALFNYGKYSFWTFFDGDYTKLSFLFNYFDQDNYYLLNLNPDNTNQPSLDLEKTVGGVTSTLVSATPLFTTYEWTYIQVERESSGLISVLVDNTLQYQINDLDHTGLSKIGFKSKEPTSYVDDFCFEEYAIFNEIGKEQQAKISLYPNPGTDLVRITGLNELTVFVYNVQGKLLFSTNEKSIDTQALESGIYIFKIFDSKGYSENLKFVKR